MTLPQLARRKIDRSRGVEQPVVSNEGSPHYRMKRASVGAGLGIVVSERGPPFSRGARSDPYDWPNKTFLRVRSADAPRLCRGGG